MYLINVKSGFDIDKQDLALEAQAATIAGTGK